MLHIGVDYYPEHWERSRWQKDIALMQKTGVTTVRLAEFSWGLLEPAEGCFDFAWLDAVMELLAQAGLEVILGTPTNCPPLWMLRNYPETLQVERSGQPTATGIRGHRCIENPTFRRYAARILEELTRRYGKMPNVIGWQIDNELEANHCCCPVCAARFREWLQKKYGVLAALNAAWGTDVWSGEISDWSQITPPLGSAYQSSWYNPGYLLDYERFAADSTAGYVDFQNAALRQGIPAAVPVTTNTCFGLHTMDFHKLFAHLDVAAYDNYPETRLPADPEAVYTTAAALDLMRGAKRQNFWLMEQLSGPKGAWCPITPTTRPGMIEGYGLQTIAHGADLLLQFRWRSAVKGAEMFWHGLIDQSGVPGRRFSEFARLCARVKALDWLEDTTVCSSVAILYGAEQAMALQIQPQTPGFEYWQQIRRWQAAFGGLGVNTDLIAEDAPLAGYGVVVVPCHFVVNPVTVHNLTEFAQNGGTVLVTARSGVKDETNGCIMEPLPTAFAALCGCTVSEYDPTDRPVPLAAPGLDAEAGLSATLWCDLLQPGAAEPLAFYAAEYYRGTPAICKNRYGRGMVYYVGTCGNRPLLRALAVSALNSRDLPFLPGLPEGVQVTTRQNARVCARFTFNESENAQTVRLDGREQTLAPFEMRIDRKER